MPPVLPIGAEGLAGKDQSQGRRGFCAVAYATEPRPEGAPALDCDPYPARGCLHGGRARPGLCSRGHRRSITAGTADLRERASRPGSGAPVRASAREGATWPPLRGFIRAWMADDVDKGMLLIEQHHVPKEAALFGLSLVKAARRALLSAEGYQVDRALAVLDQWMEDAAERAAG